MPNPNKDGYYRQSISVPDNNGNSRRIYIRAKTPEELARLVERAKIEIERGELCFNSNTKFSRWAQEWLTVYKTGVCKKNHDTYADNIRKHIEPTLGKLPINSIRPVHCQKVLNLQAGKSKSHVGKLRMTMYQIFEQAIENGYIVKNPARKLTLPTVTEGTHRPITDFEREHILKLAETHRAGLWILVMLYCGLRPTEAITLNWGDIDFNEGFISVSHDTKTKAGIRRVPAPAVLMEALRKERTQSNTTFVFHLLRNPLKPYTEASMGALWADFKRGLDVSMGAEIIRGQVVLSVVAADLTPYCLRHTCATDYQIAGVPLNIAKVLLGHKDVQVTANIYTHYTEAGEKKTGEILSVFWGETKAESAKNVPNEKNKA